MFFTFANVMVVLSTIILILSISILVATLQNERRRAWRNEYRRWLGSMFSVNDIESRFADLTFSAIAENNAKAIKSVDVTKVMAAYISDPRFNQHIYNLLKELSGEESEAIPTPPTVLEEAINIFQSWKMKWESVSLALESVSAVLVMAPNATGNVRAAAQYAMNVASRPDFVREKVALCADDLSDIVRARFTGNPLPVPPRRRQPETIEPALEREREAA